MSFKEILEIIKKECSFHTECYTCPFRDSDNGCYIQRMPPNDWQIAPTPIVTAPRAFE